MSDSRPVLALDLDNTLTWFTRPYLWWTTARSVPDDEIWNPNLIDGFQRGDGLILSRPTPYSQMAVGELSKIVRLVIVTARNTGVEDATRTLVARYFTPYIELDDIVLVGHDNGKPVTSKLETILDCGLDPIGIVDDLYRTA